jgi:hypothetical protein
MHTYIHTNVHTYIHTYIHTYLCMYIHTCQDGEQGGKEARSDKRTLGQFHLV